MSRGLLEIFLPESQEKALVPVEIPITRWCGKIYSYQCILRSIYQFLLWRKLF